MNEDNYYEILNLDRNCTKKEIKAAYMKLALVYHPDKLSPDASEEEKKKFVKIVKAYEVLSDDEKRRQYDNPIPFPFPFPFATPQHQGLDPNLANIINTILEQQRRSAPQQHHFVFRFS